MIVILWLKSFFKYCHQLEKIVDDVCTNMAFRKAMSHIPDIINLLPAV